MLSVIAKTQRTMRCHWTFHRRETPIGSGYCEDQGVRIELWTDWRLFGLLIWRRREFVRDLMPYEWISRATLGSEL